MCNCKEGDGGVSENGRTKKGGDGVDGVSENGRTKKGGDDVDGVSENGRPRTKVIIDVIEVENTLEDTRIFTFFQ